MRAWHRATRRFAALAAIGTCVAAGCSSGQIAGGSSSAGGASSGTSSSVAATSGSSSTSGSTSTAGSTSSSGSSSASGSSSTTSAASSSSTSSSGCGPAPSTITLPFPTGAAGTWGSVDLTGLPHPTAQLPCTTCHESCATAGMPNTLIGYDHSNPALVCNYCHDPKTKIVATGVNTGSMANYRSSTDSEVCTCCHNGTNNQMLGFPAEPATPIVPSSPACTGTSSWQLIFPVLNAGVFSGGQFFNNH